jgi:uncharacterized membrane protein
VLFIRIRAFSLEVISILLNLYFILRDAYQNRRSLLKLARLGLKAAKWGIVKFSGLTVVFFSGFVLIALPVASFLLVYAGMSSPTPQPVMLTFAVVIADLVYGLPALVGLGTGLWMVAPKRRIGRFGQRLVVEHIFRRKKGKGRVTSFVASASFGLIHRLAPKLS